jgi:hypothetical protein
MQPSVKSPSPATRHGWVYASLIVVDGERRLKPSHVGPDDVRFPTPPRLTSEKIEIILTNGDEEQRNYAIVLPHDPDATQIPIELLPPHKIR